MGDAYSDIRREVEAYFKWRNEHPEEALMQDILYHGTVFHEINDRWKVYAYRGKFYLYDREFAHKTPLIAEFDPKLDFEEIFGNFMDAVKDYKSPYKK